MAKKHAPALIPSLLLQPLVENAIKYGIARSEEGGQSRIAAKVFAGDLLLELSDDGPGVELVEGLIPMQMVWACVTPASACMNSMATSTLSASVRPRRTA